MHFHIIDYEHFDYEGEARATKMATGGQPAGNRCGQIDSNGRRDQPPNPPIRHARASEERHDVGYDCEFVKRPSSDLVQADCPVCLLVLREPHQVTCCGYSFCQTCIQRVQFAQNACPACNEEFTTFPNKGLKRTIYSLKVYCSQRRLGCEWEGQLGELDRHLNLQPPSEKLLEGCQFSEVECTLCLQAFQRHYLQAHQSDDCPKRPFACQYCNQHEATFEEVTQSHWPICPSFPLPCPNNCDLVLQRQELEQHVGQDCRLTLLDCDFQMAGCGVCLPRRDMPSHMSENLIGHMSLLCVHMATHPGENVATCMGLMVGTIQKVVIENAHTRSRLHEVNEELHDQLHELQVSHDKFKKAHDDGQDKLHSAQEIITQLQQTVISQNKENQLLAKNVQMSQEKITELEGIMKAQSNVVTTRKEQEERFDAQQVAIMQSHDVMTQELSAFQQSLVKHKYEITEMMKAREKKVDKLFVKTEKKIQTSLATSEAKLHTSLLASEQKLQMSLATNQNKVLAKCSDDYKILQQASTEQKRKQHESEARVMALKNDFSHRIAASEQNICAQEATLTLHQQTLERVTCTGELPFDFTMTEFKSKKEDGLAWISSPFYTHTHGYRMCIKVAPSGSGDGKGTHLSVYCHLMQGPFDDNLLWPFQGALTIQLLNQLENTNHHTHTIDFTITTDPRVIRRVTSSKRASTGTGNPTFIPLYQLDIKSKGNLQYVKDDQLKFRVIKATNLDPTSHIYRRCLKLESFAAAIEPQVTLPSIECTLTNFEQHKNDDSVWHSLAFYTHKRGYRMCLKVYPYGRNDAKGTHVSVYTCLMRGAFDGELNWPFQGDVTIQIVDQAGENHYEKVVHYNYKTPDLSCNRVTDKERTFGHGSRNFLPHTSLDHNAATNTVYLREDSLRFRVTKVELKDYTPSHLE